MKGAQNQILISLSLLDVKIKELIMGGENDKKSLSEVFSSIKIPITADAGRKMPAYFGSD